MAGSIYGVSSVYGVNSIYGVNSYKTYLSSIASRQTNQIASLLNTAVANSRLTGSTQAASASYLTSMNDSIYSMYLAGSMLAMGNKTAVSTDSSAISATAQKYASVGSYSLKVSNLAHTQVNTGSSSVSNDKSVIGAGLNIFKVKSGTTERNISVAISSTDTNKAAFTKLATAINNSNVGIRASVATDSGNKSYLTLESVKTGTKSAFSLSDLQGNAVSATGIGKIESKAQDAVYSVDGKQYTSSSNTIALDNGKVQATLKKAGGSEVSLSVVPDTSSSLPDFYTYYNNMLSSGNYYSSRMNGQLLDMFL